MISSLTLVTKELERALPITIPIQIPIVSSIKRTFSTRIFIQ